MEPIVIIAILWLLGRGKKAETPAGTASRGISPSVTPPLTTQSGYQTPQTSQLPPPNTSTTMTPTFTDETSGGVQGEFGSLSQGIAAVGRRGGSAPVRKFTEEKAVPNAPGEFGTRSRGTSVVGRRGGSGIVDKSAIGRPPSALPTPVYRPMPTPRPAPAPLPPSIPSQAGTPPPQEPKTVVPIQRESPSLRDTVASGGIPDFCFKEYRPFLLSPCAEGAYEPALRPGPPPAGALVVTGPVLGAQRSNAWPSCPDARGQGGVWHLTAGSPEWNVICPPAANAPEI